MDQRQQESTDERSYEERRQELKDQFHVLLRSALGTEEKQRLVCSDGGQNCVQGSAWEREWEKNTLISLMIWRWEWCSGFGVCEGSLRIVDEGM